MNVFRYTTGFPSEASKTLGLDVRCPRDLIVPSKRRSFKIDLDLRGTMYDPDGKKINYMLVPRLSTATDTSLRMSNSIGIMEAEHRDSIVAVVDNIHFDRVLITQGQRLFQLVCFNGLPIRAEPESPPRADSKPKPKGRLSPPAVG